MKSSKNHLVIMAGGVGSRFWPMSTPEKPKQFIDVLGTGKTLLQLTVERFGNLVAPENIWVVTNEKYADIVAEQLPDMPRNHMRPYRDERAGVSARHRRVYGLHL